MSTRTVRTSAPPETEALGAEIARALRPGDIVLLRGEVGAGKTTLVRGAAGALGVTGPVTSPTYTLGRRYDDATPPVSHLDLHRLASLDGEDPALLDDYVGPERVAFVEWPDVATDELPTARFRVTLAHAGGDSREITIEDARDGAP